MAERELPSYIRVVAEGLKFPEGPVAMNDGSILLVECWGGNLARISPQGEYSVVAYLGGRPAGTAIGPDGRAYICNDGGQNERETDVHRATAPNTGDFKPGGGLIQVVDLATGEFETLYTAASGWPIGAANDLVFDAHGGFYFTDFAKRTERMSTRGRVCYGRPDGSGAHDVVLPMDTANGVGLSPDGQTLYVAQADHARLWAFDLDGPGKARAAPGRQPRGRLLCALPDHSGFDSLGVDAGGYICVATTRTGFITVVEPDGSGYTQVNVGDTHVTNICWGGAEMKTAFITLGGMGKLGAMTWERPGLGLHFLNR
jgi:gluconolactonase